MAEADATSRPLPSPRREVANELDRAMVVAEAKMLCRQLDSYLELMGQWIEQGLDDDDAE